MQSCVAFILRTCFLAWTETTVDAHVFCIARHVRFVVGKILLRSQVFLPRLPPPTTRITGSIVFYQCSTTLLISYKLPLVKRKRLKSSFMKRRSHNFFWGATRPMPPARFFVVSISRPRSLGGGGGSARIFSRCLQVYFQQIPSFPGHFFTFHIQRT